MTRPASRRAGRAAALTLALAVALTPAGCGTDGPTGSAEDAHEVPVTIQAAAASPSLAGMSVDVSGPGIATPVVGNLALQNGRFTGRVNVPAGGDRTFTAHAFDARAIETHAGSVTADVRPGQNVVVSITLNPRHGGVPIEVTVGTYTVAVTPGNATLQVGDAPVQFTATVLDAGGQVVQDAQLEWASSNPVVASVDEAGMVTAGHAGETQIVANYLGLAAAAAVTVGDGGSGPAPEGQIVIEGAPVTLGVGESQQLTARVYDAAGQELPADGIQWAVSEPQIAEVTGDGLVTGLAPGATAVTATADGVSATAMVTVVGAAGATAWASISAGFRHSCALTPGGIAYCWGFNENGEIGDGTRTERVTPTRVAGGLAFASISAGGPITCGLATDGAAYCWGSYSHGQQNGGSLPSERAAPAAVTGGLAFASVSAGYDHACGLTAGGVAYCWGSNVNGEIGDGTTTNRDTPTEVAGGRAFAAISAGVGYTCALTPTGDAYCWGASVAGELGDGRNESHATPEPVAGGLQFASISAGYVHSCAVTTSGAAYCWGSNESGRLGDGASGGESHSPVRVGGGISFSDIRAGLEHTCALADDGEAYCWGLNDAGILEYGAGRLGDGSLTSRSTPTRVAGGLAFARVEVGHAGMQTCGLTAALRAYCWGGNRYGEVGDGTTVDRRVPSPVADPTP
jgi:alpha-tubulin suppressor-like RCC1 family protein